MARSRFTSAPLTFAEFKELHPELACQIDQDWFPSLAKQAWLNSSFIPICPIDDCEAETFLGLLTAHVAQTSLNATKNAGNAGVREVQAGSERIVFMQPYTFENNYRDWLQQTTYGMQLLMYADAFLSISIC